MSGRIFCGLYVGFLLSSSRAHPQTPDMRIRHTIYDSTHTRTTRQSQGKVEQSGGTWDLSESYVYQTDDDLAVTIKHDAA